jgi:ribonuclease R
LARSFQQKVWDYFKRDARRAVSVKELSSELGLNQDQTRLLRLFLKSQVKIGALEPRRRGRYVLVHRNSPLSGAEQPAKARFGWHFDWSDDNMRTSKEHATFTVHDMHSLRELEVESFPSGVEEFASNVAAQALDAEVSRRLDLRDASLVTIDGADAKDFDDAVGVLEVTDSHIKVAVAIADVAHYVEEDSVLDLEAARRATSVYLPGICFPMLPEALSNGACSLRPDEDRLSLVAILTYTRDGRLTKSTLHEAIINSKARLTYDQVGALLDAIDESGHTPQVSEDDNAYGRAPAHADDLVLLAGLTAKLRSLRTKRGALDLDIPEPSFVFDEEGHLEDIQSYERNRAHFLIEELMLQANEAVAAFLLSHELPGIYRNHGWPDEQKLAELLDLMMGYGLSDPKMKAYANRAEESDDSSEKEHPKHLFSPQDFADMTKSFGDHPARRLFQQWLLRTMQQAVYAADNEGHFGLALEHYLHFTSPIRRYPDLCVHRVVKRYLQKSLRPKDKAAYQQAFEEIADYVSKRERRVMQVERESHSCFQALLMSEHIGEKPMGRLLL